jgi:hypothetical protein
MHAALSEDLAQHKKARWLTLAILCHLARHRDRTGRDGMTGTVKTGQGQWEMVRESENRSGTVRRTGSEPLELGWNIGTGQTVRAGMNSKDNEGTVRTGHVQQEQDRDKDVRGKDSEGRTGTMKEGQEQ